MPKLIDLKQGSAEWHAWRRWKIGASMAPAIMGVSPFMTKLQCWESIVFAEQKEPNYAMERGTRLEAESRDIVNKFTYHPIGGLKFQPACIEHDSIPWMIASMDGAIVETLLCFSNGGCKVLKALEIKCPGKEAHMMALQGECPYYYYPQVQHQMVVCDLKEILYVSYDGEENVHVRVKRDDEYITNQLMPTLAAFYQSVIDFTPPEASGMDCVTIVDSVALNIAREYAEVTMNIEQLQKIQENLKEELCGYASHGRCNIGNLRVNKIARRGNLDYQRFLKDKELKIPDSYRKENSISWRITQN